MHASSNRPQGSASLATSSISATLTSSRAIQPISERDWRGFLGWQTKSGNVEPVFDALVRDPVEDRDVTICVKLYRQGDQNRGMVNEITGWLIADALGLPQPSRAFVVKVPMAELEKPPQAWVAELKKAAAHYWAFATLKVPAETAALQFSAADIPLLVEDIQRWDNLPGAVALDEHIANTDRHLNNLLRLGKANYALIDNGRLAVEGAIAHWGVAELDPKKLFTNQLSRHLEKNMAMTLGTVEAAASHKDALARVRAELEDWWRRLIPNATERTAFDAFITARGTDLSKLLSRRYHLLAF